jgi:DNA-binding GntR family transcriptional regulator
LFQNENDFRILRLHPFSDLAILEYSEPVASTKVEEITGVLKDAIMTGEIPPGTLLRQDSLSEELGVSRTPVREALRHLAAQGLVTVEPNRGARVRLPSHEELKEIFLIRAELEALAAQLAVTQITRAELKDLRAADRHIARLTQALKRANGELELRWHTHEWNRANIAFHEVILAAARAPLLSSMTRTLLLPGPLEWVIWGNKPDLDEMYDSFVLQHHAIVVAFEQKDPAVRELAKQHILDSLALLETIFANIFQPRRLLLGNLPRSGDEQSAATEGILKAVALIRR